MSSRPLPIDKISVFSTVSISVAKSVRSPLKSNIYLKAYGVLELSFVTLAPCFFKIESTAFFLFFKSAGESTVAFTFSASFSDILNLITKPFFKGVPYIAYPVESGPLCLRPCNIRPICSPTLTVFFLFITPAIPHILFSYLILW